MMHQCIPVKIEMITTLHMLSVNGHMTSEVFFLAANKRLLKCLNVKIE